MWVSELDLCAGCGIGEFEGLVECIYSQRATVPADAACAHTQNKRSFSRRVGATPTQLKLDHWSPRSDFMEHHRRNENCVTGTDLRLPEPTHNLWPLASTGCLPESSAHKQHEQDNCRYISVNKKQKIARQLPL